MKIEAESYSQMQNIVLENNGTTVGYFDANDWLRYDNINFDANFKSIKFQIAKQSTGGAVEIRLDAIDGSLLATFYPESNNSWTVFTSQMVNIEAVSGTHTLFLVGTQAQGICNLDFFILSQEKIYEPNWVLNWADEFEGTDVNQTYWKMFYDGNPHNGELQFYTPRSENILVSDGTLKLIARKESFTGQGPYMSEPVTRQYTSGKIETQGKITFQYGKIEASMKLPRGKGTWPAFWLLGENLFDANVGWPKCGEIDIMEHGQDFDNLGAAIHTEAYNHTIGTQKTGTYIINNYDTEFHTYGLVWSATELSFNVDGNKYFTVKKADLGSSVAQWPFDQPFWIILNHAVGGAWGGTPDDALYPHTVEVDWVRVYKDEQISTSLESKNLVTISVFPNPVQDLLNVKLDATDKNYIVQLQDISGKVIFVKEQNEILKAYSISNLENGIYFISIFENLQFIKTFKIIKQ